MIAAVPRIASAFGSDSGSSCSATVLTWSRSPVKTLASGTSFADFDSCSKTTPAQICKNAIMIVAIPIGVPLKPRKRIADETMVELVK